MAKISSFIIGMLLISLFSVGFILIMNNMNTNYGSPIGFDNAVLQEFNKTSTLINFTEDVKNETLEASESTGVSDILGDFFSAGYKAARLSAQSVETGTTLVNSGVKQMGLGEFGFYLKIILGAIILIVITAILLRALLKVDW